MTSTKNLALPVLTGILLGIAFPAWHLYPIAWIAFIPLLWDTRAASPRSAGARFFLSGMVFHLILLHWLLSNVYWAGGWAFWGYAALCGYLSVYWAVTGMVWSWLRDRSRWPLASVAIACLWTVMEALQARLFTGFGWSAIAYSQGPNLAILQLAALGGAGLITFLIVFVNVLIARALSERRLRGVRIFAALLVLLASHTAGYTMLEEAQYDDTAFTVGVLQSDFPLEMKWDSEYTEDMVEKSAAKSVWMARQWNTNLVVWPESLVMSDPIRNPHLGRIIEMAARDSESAYFVGSVRDHDGNRQGYNSSFLVDATGAFVDHYDKIHLAPFGEYVPLSRYLPFIQKIVPAIGDISPGNEVKVFDVDGRRLGPLICFEVLFDFRAENLRKNGADFLVVITNLGWFGASAAIPQEFEIARMRAVETRLPLVHSANTGISGVFDPYGRFSVVDSWMGDDGRFYSANRAIRPRHVIMQRMFGAFPLADPGSRPLAGGPVYFWRIVAVFSFLMIGAVAVAGRSASRRFEDGR